MADEQKQQGWWQTIPGILTATAGIITALAGLIVALYQAGAFDTEGKRAPQSQNTTITPPESNKPPALPETSPGATGVATAGQPQNMPKRINLLAPENDGHLLVASSDGWRATIDGKEDWAQLDFGTGTEAVFAFKDERAATFDLFTTLIINSTNANVKEFALSAGNDLPTGSFEPIGKFQTQNVKLFKTPYQEFRFPPTKAKYLKVKLISTYGDFPHPAVYEFQLFGYLN